MRVYLMQHGKPVPEEVNPERPLSDQGKVEVKQVAEFLKKNRAKVDKIVHSGKTRARETAEIIAAKLGSQIKAEERKGLSPLDDVKEILDEISASEKDLFFAGHLPHLAKLTSLMVAGNESPPVVRFQQGGMVCLEKDDAGKWSIAWMVVPEILS